MTEIEVAKIIIKQDGSCFNVSCNDCPAKRECREKVLNDCDCLWYYDDEQKEWFENWLSENE